MTNRWPLHAYLIILMFALAMPLVGLLGYSILRERTKQEQFTTIAARQIANTFASATEARLKDTRTVLDGVAGGIGVQVLSGGECTPVMQVFSGLAPVHPSLVILDTSGRAVCTSVPAESGAWFGDRPWFASLLQSGNFTVGTAEPGLSADQRVVALASPVYRKDQELVGAAVFLLDLDRVRDQYELMQMPSGALFGIVNAQGMPVLTDGPAGDSGLDQATIRAMVNSPRGSIRTTDHDGVERQFAYASVPSAAWTVYAGVPATAAASFASQAARDLTIAGIVVLVMVIFATFWANGTIGRPIRALAAAARAVEHGRLETRLTVTGPAEIAEVAQTFNAMVTQRRDTEHALTASEARFRAIYEGAAVGIVVVDLGQSQRIITCNTAFQRLVGYSEQEIIHRDIAALTYPDDRNTCAHELTDLIAGRRPTCEMERRFVHRCGHAVWARVVISMVPDAGDSPTLAIVLVHDISAQKAAEDALRRSETYFRQLIEHASDIMLVVSPAGISYASPSAERLLGYRPDEMIGRSLGDFVADGDLEQLNAGLGSEFDSTDSQEWALAFRHANGSTRTLEGLGRPFADPDGMRQVVLNLRDVTERMELERALREQETALRLTNARLETANHSLQHLSLHDDLTGLANRRAFHRHFDRCWRAGERRMRPVSLILLDVDLFKAFNDRYGHLAGDWCLQSVAEEIRQLARRPDDLAVRYGGEEFAVILPDTPLNGAREVAERIRQRIEAMVIAYQNFTTQVTVSAGVACMQPASDCTAADLVASADSALYLAKRRGRNRVELSEDQSSSARPLDMITGDRQ